MAALEKEKEVAEALAKAAEAAEAEMSGTGKVARNSDVIDMTPVPIPGQRPSNGGALKSEKSERDRGRDVSRLTIASEDQLGDDDDDNVPSSAPSGPFPDLLLFPRWVTNPAAALGLGAKCRVLRG